MDRYFLDDRYGSYQLCDRTRGSDYPVAVVPTKESALAGRIVALLNADEERKKGAAK
jgi:hypothetical protein